jgi:hypothetical protein
MLPRSLPGWPVAPVSTLVRAPGPGARSGRLVRAPGPGAWFDCLVSARSVSRRHALADGSPWQVYLAGAGRGGLDPAQLRTIVRVLAEEPALAPVWNWQSRGVRRHAPPAGHHPAR